ncbi:helix-turn-helix domain-containing protein [Prosthecomicrobium hirschii]|nr:helix-turn-helix domain-containing protein [Prosthecomicrobium hirschii]
MVRTVIAHVARTTGIDATLLASEARSRPIAQARHLAMYLARALCGASYAQIGERLGGRDHTTAHHGVHAAMRRFGLPRPEQLPRAVALRLLLDGPPDLAAEHLVQHGR